MTGNFVNKVDTFRRTLEGIKHTAQFTEDITILTPGPHSVPLLPESSWCTGQAHTACINSAYEFEPGTGRLQGATDSLHGVFFGTLYFNEGASEVAVKPFFSGVRLAIREYVSYHFMNDQGFESFEPMGIVVSESGQATLVTKLEPSIVTLDNVSWSPDALEHEDDMGHEAIKLLGTTASLLAQMHVKGITHGDAQPKNVATSERGRTGFIDFETLHYAPEHLKNQAFEQMRIADAIHFYSKLKRYGYYPDSQADRFVHFDEQFIDPYEQTAQKIDEKFDKNLIKRIRGELAEIILTEEKTI